MVIMIKNNKLKLIISSIIILLPMLIGFIFWNELPAQMTTHWGADAVADGQSTKLFAVVGLPLILLLLHWVCVFFTARDPKNKGQNKKVFGMVLWICPVISFFANGIVYAAAFGKEFDITALTMLLIGLLLVIMGNYLPKCKQNHTIGIKIKWTLENEENWNATHRMSGKLWVIGGLILMLCAFLPLSLIPWALTLIILILVAVPFIYSYIYHRKQVKAGTAFITPVPKTKSQKLISIVSLVIVALILIFVGVLMFTGNIEVQYNETSFTIEADYYSDLTVDYEAIDSIEYRESFDKGLRTLGFGSPRLSMGQFENEEFGAYTLYAYTSCEPCVVITADGSVLALSGSDSKSTKAIFEELEERIGS